MTAKRMALGTMGGIAGALLVAAALAAWGGPAALDEDEAERYDRLRRLSYELMKIEPLIHRIEELEEVILSAKATSPTLEQLEEIEIEAEAVEKMNALLGRVEKIEPIIKALEEMQRDFSARKRKAAGVAATRVEKWSEIFDAFQTRLAALEKRVLAPPVLRDPVAAQTPIELRLREIEERQETLARENEQLRKELRRLRRERLLRAP